jgi:RHS repeat-associated protein
MSSQLFDGSAPDCSMGLNPGTCITVAWPTDVGPYFRRPVPAVQGTIVPTWLGTLNANGQTGSGPLHRRFREFDPATGQFTHEDPIGFAGGYNLDGFANGDPLNYADPFGLQACDPICGAAADAVFRQLGARLGAVEPLLELAASIALMAPLGGGEIAAASLSISASRTAASALAANVAAGRAAERRAARLLEASGATIVGSQVTVRTGLGLRRIDHVVQLPDASLVAIEVKAGRAVRTAAQRAKDAALESEGGLFVGKNSGVLRGQVVQLPTIVVRP